MYGLAGQQIERVGQNLDHGQQRLRCTSWAAWQVEDERAPTHTANTPAQDGVGSTGHALRAHSLRNAFDQLRAHSARRLRRDIAISNAGSTRRHNQLDLLTQANKHRFDRPLIVWNDLLMGDIEPLLAKQLGSGRPGAVAPRGAKANVNFNCPHVQGMYKG